MKTDFNEYQRQFQNAIDKATASLSDPRRLELQRRKCTVSAILISAPSKFKRQREVEELRHAEDNNYKQGLWILSFIFVGIILHHFFSKSSFFEFSVEFNFGTFLILIGMGIWLMHLVKLALYEREAKSLDLVIEELLYRWLANGGQEKHFFELRDLTELKGRFDFDSEECIRWWFKNEENLLDKIFLGFGEWQRPARLDS